MAAEFIWKLNLPLVRALIHRLLEACSSLGSVLPASLQELHRGCEPDFPLPKLCQLFPGML